MSLTRLPSHETVNLVEPSIEEAYAHVAGAKIHVYTHIPGNITEDSEQILIADGYFSRARNYEKLAAFLARQGHIVTRHEPADGQAGYVRAHHSHWDGDKLSCQAIDASRKKTNEILDLDPSTKQVMIGHSLGAYHGAKFAEHRPQYVKQLIPVASAGMDKHDFPEMLERTGHVMMTHLPDVAYELGANPAQFMYNSMMHVFETFGSPSKFDRRFREGLTAVYCDTKSSLHKARQSGIPIDIICFTNDAYSTVDENTRAAKETDSRLHIIEGNHLTPQFEPERLASELDNIIKFGSRLSITNELQIAA
jgi:predicted alpha/beta hydrolase family esterase